MKKARIRQGSVATAAVACVALWANQNPPSFKFLKSFSGQEIQLAELHGATKEGSSILVEERTNSQSDYAGTIKKHYWLNVDALQETPLKNVGGDVVYNAATQNYVFSCAVYSAAGACLPHAFAVLKETNLSQESNALIADVPSVVGFSKFSKTLTLEK